MSTAETSVFYGGDAYPLHDGAHSIPLDSVALHGYTPELVEQLAKPAATEKLSPEEIDAIGRFQALSLQASNLAIARAAESFGIRVDGTSVLNSRDGRG